MLSKKKLNTIKQCYRQKLTEIRNIFIILASCAVLLGFNTSCLDKYPENAIPADRAITNLEELDQAAIGMYSAFKSSALYSGYLTLLPDIQCDMVHAVNGYTNTYGNIWRWDILSTNSEITSVYASLYNVIACANFLLEYAPRVEKTLTTDEEWSQYEQICGEAYFARALAYSELIKLYCKSYESAEQAESDLGVVIVTKYNTDEPMVRSSLAQSYDRVIEDLDMAAKLMDIDENNVGGNIYNATYFNEYTAYALRARVALYMKDYETAIEYSSRVIDSNLYLLFAKCFGEVFFHYCCLCKFILCKFRTASVSILLGTFLALLYELLNELHDSCLIDFSCRTLCCLGKHNRCLDGSE